jgi:restriction system protein
MKLKMAKHSIFAVLLRSPAWISFVVVAAFVGGSLAWLPKDYVPFGVMGCFPFLVVGCIAAWRQWQTPNPEHVAQALAAAAAMSWRDFASAMERGYVRQGYTVTRLNSQAAEFSIEKDGHTTVVACKRWKAASHGVEALRDLVAVQVARGANAAVYVSLGGVTEKAISFAQASGVVLMPETVFLHLISN